jgi:hypothetical protein
MAERGVAAVQAQHLTGHDTLAMQHDQAMHRAHELYIGVAPAHHLRDRQFFQRVGNDLAEHGFELDALDRGFVEQVSDLPSMRFSKLAISETGMPLASSFFSSAGLGLPAASSATDTGMTFSCTLASGASASTAGT